MKQHKVTVMMDLSGSSSAMDDSTQPPPSTQPAPTPLPAFSPLSASVTPFSASSPTFSSLSSSSSASQSAPSSFSSTFPADTASTFTQSSPSFTPFSFPAVPNDSTAATADTATTTASRRSRPFRATSGRPAQPLLHAGSKRGSLSRDEDDDDDYEAVDDDDLPARPLKRLHGAPYGSELGEEDEEDVRADFEDEEFKDDPDAAEDTFANLLTHFAALHVPSSSTKPEQCPICSKIFPLSEFADHVYSCLTVLDDVEKKEQERLDEKMARQLMAREVRLLDDEERHSSYSRDRRAMGSECLEGADCQRTDAQHFQLRSHPEVACPVCGLMLPLFDIYAHVSGCVQDDGGGEGKAAEREPGSMEDEMSAQQQQESRAKAAIDTSSSAFASFRGDKQRREMADDDSHLPIARDSDDEEDERKRSPSPPLDPALARAATASPPPAAAASANLRLTVEQASAVASMIKEKQRGGDESVAAMLDTFKQLGFTQENLTRLKDQQQQGKAKADDMDRKG